MSLVMKNLPANTRDLRDEASIPGLGRSPGEGHGNPLQSSCLENLMDRRAWWATVQGVTKGQTWLKQLSMHTHTLPHTTPYTLHHTLTRYTIHSYHSRKKIAITTNHSVDGSHTCNVEGKKPESKESFRRVQCRWSSNTGELCDGNQKKSCLWKLDIVWKGWKEPLGWWKYSIAWVGWWLHGGYIHFDKVLIKVCFLYCMFYAN